MKKNKLCQLLGIDHPIIQGVMGWVANAELAAAVSDAGALGLVAPNAGMSSKGKLLENLRSELAKAQKLTAEPLAVSVPVNVPNAQELVDLVIAEEVKVVITSVGSPAFYTSRFKDAEISVLHVINSVKDARAAEALGVDAVIAMGYESGGALGVEGLPTLVLVPTVVEAVEIPVIAAGGIVDGRGLAAALSLGAQAVQMGTRFIATQECVAHPAFKGAIVKAVDSSTVVTCQRSDPRRMLKGPLASKLLQMEAEGASGQEVKEFLGSDRLRAALLQGDLDEGDPACGAGSALISDVLPAAEVVQQTVRQAEEILAKLR